MLRIAKAFSVLGLVTIVVWLGVLNTQSVKLITIPSIFASDEIGVFRVPLFLIVIIAAFFGFIIGCVAEYVRAGKVRKSLRERNRSLKQSKMKIKNIEKNLGMEDDEILSLLK